MLNLRLHLINGRGPSIGHKMQHAGLQLDV